MSGPRHSTRHCLRNIKDPDGKVRSAECVKCRRVWHGDDFPLDEDDPRYVGRCMALKPCPHSLENW